VTIITLQLLTSITLRINDINSTHEV